MKQLSVQVTVRASREKNLPYLLFPMNFLHSSYVITHVLQFHVILLLFDFLDLTQEC